MVGEAIAGFGALKTAFDMARALRDIDNAVQRNAAVIELQETILSAQQAQSALAERMGQLEKQIAEFEQWQAEKEKYHLKEIYTGNFAYAIKEDARGSEPPHLVCAKCFEERKKYILQVSSAFHMTCPNCKSMIQFKSVPSPTRTSYGRGSWG